jgi:hypothetical protein
MKTINKILVFMVVFFFSACKEEEFADAYRAPGSIANSTVEKQFAGLIFSNREYVIPSYWNYFVVLRTTVNHYTQAVGWVNSTAQYVPGAGSITDRWTNYYSFLAQYRELEKIYSALPAEEQEAKRIYAVASTIYLYDHTQKVVDLHGDIPFFGAGMLSTNGGDYLKSFAPYDNADAIYTKMLDDLKAFADELNSITLTTTVETEFNTQDLVNNGNIDLWKAYCNSLRLRMLTRVSEVAAFSSRAQSEIASILADPAKYPLVTENESNIQIEIHNPTSDINSNGFQTGIEDWNSNVAGKAMIDQMLATDDPRLRVMFEPGINADGQYVGLDPLELSSNQQALIDAGEISIYNRSTFSRNKSFPGMLISAAEVNFLLAEYFLKNGDDAAAKTAYNKGIEESIEQQYLFRSYSADNTAGSVTPLDPAEITAYQAEELVNWDNASSEQEKLELIATQKWLHYNIIEPIEGWAELRRLDFPEFSFLEDNSNAQSLPPVRWFYAPSENIYNTQNYDAVRAKDNLSTRIFWDVE